MILVCCRCGKEKDSSEFYPRKGTARGFYYSCKTCDNHRNRLGKYGLSEEEYEKLFEEQSGCCAVCEKQLEFSGLGTHIDHNHQTGKIRGILCSNCNTALGLLKENTDIILSLANYITANTSS